MKKWLVMVTVAALVATACADGEEPAPVQVGLADSDAGETGSTPDGEATTDRDDGTDGNADGQGSAESEASGTNGSEATADSGSDAKTLIAVAVSELPDADEATGDLAGQVDEAEAVFDDVNEGDIEAAFGVDRWTFDGQQGQLLAIDVISIDNGCSQDLDLVLVSPEGHRGRAGWVGNGGCQVHGPFELDQSGTYAIEFVGGDGSIIAANTGAYRFVPSILTEHDVAPLILDQPNEGEISEVLGVDRWTLEAEAGSLLTVDVLSIDHDCGQDLNLVLEDPFGERDKIAWIGNGGCQGHGPIELERDGTYVLEYHGGSGAVIGERVGGYRFVPSLLTEHDEQPGSPGQRLKGEISQLFGADRWTFDARTGDELMIDVVSIGNDCNQDLTLTLEDPFGEREKIAWVGNGGCKTYGPFDLGRDGTHVIEFSGGSGAVIEDDTGPYEFSFTVG